MEDFVTYEQALTLKELGFISSQNLVEMSMELFH